MPKKFLPNLIATLPVVPLPKNGSKTIPLSGQPAFIGVSTSSILGEADKQKAIKRQLDDSWNNIDGKE